GQSQMEYCKWYLARCLEEEFFQTKIIWSDVVVFKLNHPISHHNYTSWRYENPHLMAEHHVHLPGVTKRWGLSSRRVMSPFFFLR
ncbi:hypothetical protein SK128_004345, partial [Halocaridina rubra]